MSRDHTAVVDVGAPPSDFCGWETTTVRYHGFRDLSTALGQAVESPEFTCLGNRWKLDIYPGGDTDSIEEGMVSVFLCHMSNETIKIRFSITARGKGGSVAVAESHFSNPELVFGPKGDDNNGIGVTELGSDLAQRSKILELHLVDGSLVLEVAMRLVNPKAATLTPFVPENPFCSNMLGSFMDEQYADIVFDVCQNNIKREGATSNTRATKTSKASPHTFHAHRLILGKCAPQLAELCGSGANLSTPIQITDVSPGIFRHLLYYVYGGKLSDEVMKESAKDIIEAADRYGVSNLKLEAEASYVQSTTFSMDNVLEILLFADSKNCALLKEAAMDFIVENKFEAMEKVSFQDAPPTMMTDILAAVARGEKKSGNSASSDANNLNAMRISELRRRVHEKGLDVDGSRETLIAALKGDS